MIDAKEKQNISFKLFFGKGEGGAGGRGKGGEEGKGGSDEHTRYSNSPSCLFLPRLWFLIGRG